MKYIVIVPDGMADEPVSSLDNKTPLEIAHTTNMDYLAQRGLTGMVQTIPANMKPGSDIGNLAIMGYNPQQCFFGRAALEAASQDIILGDDEIAFRCNLVTVQENIMADYSAGHISTKEASNLIKTLNDRVDVPNTKFFPGKSYRHLMVLKTPYAKEFFDIKSTPPHDIIGQDIEKYFPQGKHCEFLVDIMERSRNIFADHPVNQVRIDLKENPANMIWLWGQGIRPQLPSFPQKYNVKGGIISAVDLVNGIGKLAGLEVIPVPGITGYYDTNYLGKAQYALDSLKHNDFVFIHIEGPDEAGHNGDARMKIACIENIDKDIVGTILNHFGEHDDFRLLILPDHPTPVEKRTHTSDPVGFIMYGKGVPQDGSPEYNENTAKEKGLKFESGEALMDYFMRKNIGAS